MAKAKKATKKIVLPSKLHKPFHAANAQETTAELIALMEDNDIDINATFYKVDSTKENDAHYLFFDVLSGNKGIIEKVSYFISKGVDLSLKNTIGRTAVFVTTRPIYLPVLKLLLDAGANVNALDEDGNTFLTLLTRSYGDKYDVNTDPSIDSGFIDKSLEDYDLDIQFIDMLLAHGADPTIKNNYDTSALDWLQHRKDSDDFSDQDARLEQLFGKYK